MTAHDLARLTEEWTGRLRLQDWNLNLSIVDFLGAYGETKWDKYKNADIELCSPQTLPPQPVGVEDLEVTLIHELLHLHLTRVSNVIEPDSPEDDALEEAIEILAQAFALLRQELNELKKAPKKKRNVKNSTTGQLLPAVPTAKGKDRSKAGHAKAPSRSPKAVRANQQLRDKPPAAVHRGSLRNKVREDIRLHHRSSKASVDK